MLNENVITNRIILLACTIQFFFLSLTRYSFAANSDPNDWHEKTISTLEYIARGYEANAAGIDRLRIRGRIFHTQYAKEGKTIPESQTFPPKWYNFEHIWKGGKRRYQQDNITKKADSKKQLYALDNNERLLTFTNTVVIHPLTREESTWNGLTSYYGSFFSLNRIFGCENVGLAMRTFIESINEGWYDNIPGHGSIRVEATDEGLFVIHLETDINKQRLIIDSHKGFNLIAAEKRYRSEKSWKEIDLRCEYIQLPNGHYMLKSGQRTGFYNDIVYEYRLETKDIQTDFEAPDEWFEEESLNIPLDATRTDYSYSPPLKFKKGDSKLELDSLEELLDSDIGKTKIANINNEGKIDVNDHQAFVEHERSDANKNSINTIATSGGKLRKIVFSVVFFVFVMGAGVASISYYSHLKRTSKK